MSDDRPAASVPCGSCSLCCKQEAVALFAEAGDDLDAYETTSHDTPHGTLRLLVRRQNGDCVYLGPAGCTIYDRRPAVCRTFDCGAWFARHTRAERRVLGRDDAYIRALFARGREIQEGRRRP